MLRSPIRASAIFQIPLGSGSLRILVRALRWRVRDRCSGLVLVAECHVGGDLVGVDPVRFRLFRRSSQARWVGTKPNRAQA